MSIFNYTLPSGATFQLNAPAGTTQAQADVIFYSQVASGTFVGYKTGDKLTHPKEALNNFGITRLQRGTAGVDDKTLLAIIAGLPVVAPLPNLSTVPVANAINSANYLQVASVPTPANPSVTPAGNFSQGSTGVGQLSAAQTQAVMAQIASTVGQAYNVITQAKGVGKYGFNSQQLEKAGYIKPGYSQQYCPINPATFANPNNFVSFMESPTPWTGLNAVTSVSDILNNLPIQNQIQESLMIQSYNTYVSLGIIVPSIPTVTTPSISTGQVYSNTGSLVSASVLSLLTNPTGSI